MPAADVWTVQLANNSIRAHDGLVFKGVKTLMP